MNQLEEKVRRVIRELDDIRAHLDQRAGDSPEQAAQLQSLQQLDLLQDFKTSVDQARHTLWAYIEALTRKKGDNIERALQAIRMQRATDMLRVLRENAGETDLQMPEAHSFIDEIQAIASTALEKHYRRPS